MSKYLLFTMFLVLTSGAIAFAGNGPDGVSDKAVVTTATQSVAVEGEQQFKQVWMTHRLPQYDWSYRGRLIGKEMYYICDVIGGNCGPWSLQIIYPAGFRPADDEKVDMAKARELMQNAAREGDDVLTDEEFNNCDYSETWE